ncbi:MAG: GNAT family N-acetyltransferase [Dehalococcoidales bacterium]|nr:GNAT family N-acetyltransferase [Dehalococcoidales bacterium]
MGTGAGGEKLSRKRYSTYVQEQLAHGLLGMQCVKLYRRVARSLKHGIEIAELDEGHARHLSHLFNFKQSADNRSRGVSVTHFAARKRDQVIGYASLVGRSRRYHSHDGHWLINLAVRTTYRGMGIGEELTRFVMEKSMKSGASEISLLVFEDNAPAIKLYRKLGFERKVIPALEKELEDEQRILGRRRVCMSRRLADNELPGDLLSLRDYEGNTERGARVMELRGLSNSNLQYLLPGAIH